MARVFLLCLALAQYAHSYPNGLPKKSCSDLHPGHGSESLFQAENGDRRYSVASGCYVIFPTDFMRVRVWDRENIGPIEGCCLQCIRKKNNEIVGVWSVPDGISAKLMKTMTCSNNNDALTHRNARPKTGNQTEAVWTAPATCKKNEEFVIRAVIAQTKNRWHRFEVPLVCDPDYDNVEIMERVRPPLKSQYCAQGSWAIIPKRASESFEGRLGAGGWRHFYGAPGFRFVRNSGSTPTAGTGPTVAQDGKYYLYYEATGTRKNDMAGLLSPFGIQGCFCFSFHCHMNTDGVTEFTLSTIGAAKTLILRTREVTNFWRRVAYSILSDKPVVFAFQVFSSGSDKGDVAIDNIEVTPGPCDAKADGYAGFRDL